MTETTATAEDYINASFEGVQGAGAPDRDEWMRTAEEDYNRVAEGIAILRHSSKELAKIVGESGQFEVWGALLDYLINMKQEHRGTADNLETITTRLLVAIHQAYPQEATGNLVVH